MNQSPHDAAPLSGVRILDLSSGHMTAVAKLLQDVGAAVTSVVIPGITEEQPLGPFVDGVDIGIAVNRHGIPQISVDLDGGEGEGEWERLLGQAQILIETTRPGSEQERRLGIQRLQEKNPGLVVLSISDFGRNNSCSSWQATGPVFHALTSELSRSGLPGREPLLPPADLPYSVAAAQAAVMTLSVLYDSLQSGQGKRIDFSVLEAAMQTLDPAYGMTGSASAGMPLSSLPPSWQGGRASQIPDHSLQGRLCAALHPCRPAMAGDVRVDGQAGGVR